jgi:predicted secreted protein
MIHAFVMGRSVIERDVRYATGENSDGSAGSAVPTLLAVHRAGCKKAKETYRANNQIRSDFRIDFKHIVEIDFEDQDQR